METIATEQEVWRVCDEIAADGRKVTGRAVQNELGGSLKTIYTHIKNWESRSTKGVACSGDIPVDLQKAIQSALDQSARKATEELCIQLADAEERQKEVLDDLVEYEKRINDLEADLSAAQTQVTNLQQLSEKQSAIAAATNTELRERIIAIEQEKADLIRLGESDRSETLKAKLQLEYANQSVIKSENKILDYERRIVELSDALSASHRTEARAEQVDLRMQDHLALNDYLKTELDAVRREATLMSERMMLQDQESKDFITQLKKENEELRKQIDISGQTATAESC